MAAEILTVENKLQHQAQADKYRSAAKLSSNSQRTYAKGIAKFTEWLAENGYELIANADELALLVGNFLANMVSETKLSTNSAATYRAAIQAGLKDTLNIDISKHHVTSQIVKGIKRSTEAPTVKKQGLRAEDMRVVVPCIESEFGDDIRDRALLLVGFAAALRRSELIGIDVEHLEFCKKGLSIRIPRSKTDQESAGHHVEIPRRPTSDYCPVAALERWLEAAEITEGAVFRAIDRHGNLSEKRLSDKAVALIVKKRGSAAGYDSAELAGHSLRRGFVLDALECGATETEVTNTTRQAPATLRHYASEKKNWRVNANHKIAL